MLNVVLVEPEIPQKMPELVLEHKKTVQVKPAPKKRPEPQPEPEPEMPQGTDPEDQETLETP